MQDEHHINEYGTDDFSVLSLAYAGGKRATVVTAIGMDMPRYAAVYGTQGSIFLDDFQKAESIKVCVQGQEPYTLSFPISMGGFEYEIEEFSRCVQEERPSVWLKEEHSLGVLRVVQALLTQWGCLT